MTILIGSPWQLVTKRAYASFPMTWLSANAVKEGNRKESFLLLRHAYQHGKLSVLNVVLFRGIWLMPPKLRARIVTLFSGKRAFNPGLPTGQA